MMTFFTGDSITVHLKVPVNISEPPSVMDPDVPIIIKDRVRPHHEWDLTTQQVKRLQHSLVGPHHSTGKAFTAFISRTSLLNR